MTSADYTEAYDLYDDADKPLFARAKRKLGPLEPDELYALNLASALGGVVALDNLRRVKAREQLALLAQVQPPRLVDYSSDPPRIVRAIGPRD